MIINPNSRNIIGKLVYFIKPVFRINKIIDELDDFASRLENIETLEFSDPIIEGPDPNKILSKTNDWIKFNYIGFKEKVDFVDKFQFGIGENGYYYDMHLKLKNEENNIDEAEIVRILSNFETEISKILGKSFEDYFLKTNVTEKFEISNFVVNLEFKHSLNSIFNPKLVEMLNFIAGNSEEIIRNIHNDISPAITLSIHPNLGNDSIVGYDPEKVIIADRKVVIRRAFNPSNKHLYDVRLRGVPVGICFKFIRLIDEMDAE